MLRGADGAPLPPAAAPAFSNRLPPSAPANQAALTAVAEAAVPPPVVALYGPWLTAQLAIARAQFLMELASVRDCWKATDKSTGERRAACETMQKMLVVAKGGWLYSAPQRALIAALQRLR